MYRATFTLSFLVFFLWASTACAGGAVLAVLGSKTGRLAYLTQDLFRAVHYGVDEINANGGLLGQRISLIELDNESTVKGSTEAAKEAVRLGADMVIGPMVSSQSMAAGEVFQKAGIPMIATSATAPQVTKIGDSIFRACFTDDFQGRVIAYFAKKKLGATNAVIMTQVNETYSVSLTESFITEFRKMGGKVREIEEYVAGEKDFHYALDRLRMHTPDVLILPGYAKESAHIIDQAREMGMKMPIVGGDAWGNKVQKFAKVEHLQNCYQVRHWHRSSSHDISRSFLHGYEKRFGPILQDVGALAYDSLLLFAEAIKKSGSFDPHTIKDALYKVSIRGVTGTIRFDKNGDPQKGALIMTYEDGESIFHMILEP